MNAFGENAPLLSKHLLIFIQSFSLTLVTLFLSYFALVHEWRSYLLFIGMKSLEPKPKPKINLIIFLISSLWREFYWMKNFDQWNLVNSSQ